MPSVPHNVDGEYEELLGFVDLYFAIAVPETLPREVHPRYVAEQIATTHGAVRALAGTRQAVNDIVEQTLRLRPEEVRGFNAALEAEGLPTLSRLRRRYSSRYQRILRRGKIGSETEYYLAKGLVDDLSSGISLEERDQLVIMMEAYEV